MRVLAVFCLLFCLASSAPTRKDEIIIDKDFFPKSFSIHKSEHDIVNIMVPLNALNFADTEDNEDTCLFFTEADITNGKYDYKGLYILKSGKPFKLLENGRDATAPNGDNKDVYFAATDGIYKYNDKENKAEKFGTITDSIVKIVKLNNSDAMYIVTEENKLYKITEQGTKKTPVAGVGNVNDIVIDFSDNLYYYGDDKKVFVLTDEGIKKIEGLPENPKSVKLLRPPFVVEDAVAFISDENAYVISANGTIEMSDFVVKEKPTAYSMEGTLLQYYGYNKNIYEYNVISIIFGEALNQIKKFLQDQTLAIQNLASKSRNDLF